MTIVLTEHTDHLVTLPAEDIAWLGERMDTWINIRPLMSPQPTGTSAIVNPGSTVGILRLPSGVQLELRPKVPLTSLLWMLSRAYDLEPVTLDDAVNISRFDHVVEVIAAHFATMIERRIDLGLYRNYVEEEGNLTTVRGRILAREDMNRNLVERHRTYCAFTTFSWDLPENQVIRHVIHLLSGWSFSQRMRGRLLVLDAALDGIRPQTFRADDLDGIVYNRASEDYRPIHNLCRFFLDGASLTERSGSIAFDGFLIDMNLLFERTVGKMLDQHLPRPYVVREQVSKHLDLGNRVIIRPDLIIQTATRDVLLADCKYKRLAHGEHKHHDLYQMLAYCTALDVSQGVLLYPRHLVDIRTELPIRHSHVTLHEYGISLDGSIAEIEQEFVVLGKWLTDLALGFGLPA